MQEVKRYSEPDTQSWSVSLSRSLSPCQALQLIKFIITKLVCLLLQISELAKWFQGFSLKCHVMSRAASLAFSGIHAFAAEDLLYLMHFVVVFMFFIMREGIARPQLHYFKCDVHPCVLIQPQMRRELPGNRIWLPVDLCYFKLSCWTKAVSVCFHGNNLHLTEKRGSAMEGRARWCVCRREVRCVSPHAPRLWTHPEGNRWSLLALAEREKPADTHGCKHLGWIPCLCWSLTEGVQSQLQEEGRAMRLKKLKKRKTRNVIV